MISTKGRYAIRFMIDLAEHVGEKPVPLDDISVRQGISKKYLEIVVKLLVSGKMVKGTSGKGGGYRLLRSPDQYTVAEILRMTEGTLAPVACLKDDAEPCPKAHLCKTVNMWKKFNMLSYEFFNSITVQDLIDGVQFEDIETNLGAGI